MAKSSNVAVKIHTVFMIAAAVRDMHPAYLRAATPAEYHILSGVSRGFAQKYDFYGHLTIFTAGATIRQTGSEGGHCI